MTEHNKEYDELKAIQNKAQFISLRISNLLVEAYQLGIKHGQTADKETLNIILGVSTR